MRERKRKKKHLASKRFMHVISTQPLYLIDSSVRNLRILNTSIGIRATNRPAGDGGDMAGADGHAVLRSTWTATPQSARCRGLSSHL